jgi:hypothetical protein
MAGTFGQPDRYYPADQASMIRAGPGGAQLFTGRDRL